jgi:hypothetical protein
MVKIDGTELFRSFLTIEIVIVVIPVAVYWSIVGVLTLVAGFNLATFNACCLLLLFNVYLTPPGFIVSKLFHASSSGIIYEGVAVWLVAILTYSIVASLVALALSLYTPSKGRQKSTAEHAKAQNRGETPRDR